MCVCKRGWVSEREWESKIDIVKSEWVRESECGWETEWERVRKRERGGKKEYERYIEKGTMTKN